MNIAFVGTGFVADAYLETAKTYPSLKLAGVFDKNSEQLSKFCRFYSVRSYLSMDELLTDKKVDMVINLTNPRSHYEISKMCLEAGKHVYSEKPLAMEWEESKHLIKLAKEMNLRIACAPCSILSEQAQTVWKALCEGRIGKVRLVYAALDDGMITKVDYKTWRSASGTPWPYQDELEIGKTIERSGYYLSWFAGMFGPAKSVTSFASVQIADKGTAKPLSPSSPDFTSACIAYSSGVVVRLTCSIVAPPDHSIRFIGDEGSIVVQNGLDYGAPVWFRRDYHDDACYRNILVRLAKRLPLVWRLTVDSGKIPLVKLPEKYDGVSKAEFQDYARGINELAESIRDNRVCRLSEELALHINEIMLSLQYPERMGCPRQMETSFDPIEPMPWGSG